MKRLLLLSSVLLLMVLSCKKDEAPQTFCWQLVDNFGNELNTVCGKTQEQIAALYPNPCSYYKVEGERSCWLAGQTFIRDKTPAAIQHLQNCFGLGNAVKVDCSYCQSFYHRQKRTYKPSNTVTYSPVTFQQFCGDTATKLFHGREVLVKDTPDSLVLIQFSSNPSFF